MSDQKKPCSNCGNPECEGPIEIDGNIVRERIFREVIASFQTKAERADAEQILLSMERACEEEGTNVIDTVKGMLDIADSLPEQLKSHHDFEFSKLVFQKVLEVVEDLVFELPEDDNDPVFN